MMPPMLHMTVSPTFRRNSGIPKILLLHGGRPSSDEVDVDLHRTFGAVGDHMRINQAERLEIKA